MIILSVGINIYRDKYEGNLNNKQHINYFNDY